MIAVEGQLPNHFTFANDDPYVACFNCRHFSIREYQGEVRFAEQVCRRHGLKFQHRRNFLEYEKIKCDDQRPQPRE